MKKISFILFFYCCSIAVFAQSTYTPSQSNIKNRRWFEKAGLGLFIHFGVYTQLDDPDEAWAMRKYTIPQYEKLADQFDPKDFDAKTVAIDFRHSLDFFPGTVGGMALYKDDFHSAA